VSAKCSATGKLSYRDRGAARAAARRTSGERLSVYACVACLGWHLGHIPPVVARGAVPRHSLTEQARSAGLEDRAVRRCPACGAEGTARVGVLHTADCSMRSRPDVDLPVRGSR
jgi:hypothetical protein